MPSSPSESPHGDGVHRRRAHALELLLDARDEVGVRERWQLLERSGVRSLARHAGATHRPHVTLATGPRPPGQVLARAGTLLAPLLPLAVPVSGLALLGPAARVVLAELLVPPAALLDVREELAAGWPDADGRPWQAHLTLAHRLGPASLQAALQALDRPGGEPPSVRRVVALRWWDPDREEVTLLAGERQ